MAIINYNSSPGITRLAEANSAKDNREEEKIPKTISNKLDLLDTKLDNLYKSVYISRPDNQHKIGRAHV